MLKCIPWDLIGQMNLRDALFLIRRRMRLARDKRRYATPPSALRSSEIFSLLAWGFPGIASDSKDRFDSLRSHWYQSTPKANPARRFLQNIHLLSEEQRAQILKRADRILDGAYPLMGNEPIPVAHPVNWRQCPVRGEEWPQTGFADVDLSGNWATPPVDVKPVWEINRHKHLYPLGQAFLLSGKARYAELIRATLLGWIEQNPPGWGVNWAGPLELGIRSMAWCWALDCLETDAGLDGKTLAKMLVALDRQIRLMDRFLEDYLVRNTHLVGEAAALAWVGFSCPGLKSSGRWRKKGVRLLEREMWRQVLPTGQHWERSFYYHNYLIDFCAGVYALGRNTGWSFSSVWPDRLSRMFEWLARVAPPGERLPDSKDADGGQVFAWLEEDLLGWKSRLALGAALLMQPEWKEQSGGDESYLPYFLSVEEIETFRKMEKASKPRSNESDEERTVIRASLQNHEIYLLFDHSALGVGRCGHGHADLLQVLLQVGDQPILIDPGTYIYNGSIAWRNAFRSTSAHNTVTFGQKDQVEPGGPFAWKNPLVARCESRVVCEGNTILSGGHDGYVRLDPKALHHRSLFSVNEVPDEWILLCVDDIQSEKESIGELFWHFHPDAGRWNNEENRVTLSLLSGLSGELLTVVSGKPEETDHQWVEGQETGRRLGWHSPVYGRKHPAPVLVTRRNVKGTGVFVTVIHLVNGRLEKSVQLTVAEKPEGWQSLYMRSGRVLGAASGRLDWSDGHLQALGKRFLVKTRERDVVLKILCDRVHRLEWADRFILESIPGCSGLLEIDPVGEVFRWQPTDAKPAAFRTDWRQVQQPLK